MQFMESDVHLTYTVEIEYDPCYQSEIYESVEEISDFEYEIAP